MIESFIDVSKKLYLRLPFGFVAGCEMRGGRQIQS
jgi:hypothetical protein